MVEKDEDRVVCDINDQERGYKAQADLDIEDAPFLTEEFGLQNIEGTILYKLPGNDNNPFRAYVHNDQIYWKSVGVSKQLDFLELLNYMQKFKKIKSVHINTGTHGSFQGNTASDFKDKPEIVKVLANEKFYSSDKKKADQYKTLKISLTWIDGNNGPQYPNCDMVIDAWCYSSKRGGSMDKVTLHKIPHVFQYKFSEALINKRYDTKQFQSFEKCEDWVNSNVNEIKDKKYVFFCYVDPGRSIALEDGKGSINYFTGGNAYFFKNSKFWWGSAGPGFNSYVIEYK